ncbi:gamma-glutamyltransferase [Staphylococcus epidermidis]|nr:gamma-glutamyltransferase [Staphylococcus epidermidis]
MPLAEDGFEVNSELEMSIKKYSKGIDKSSPFFKGDGNTVKNGDIVKQPQLTKTLKGIKNNGPNYFYDKLAKHLTTELNGQIDKTDFNNYKSKQKKPSETKYLNTHVYSSSNPLGGGLMLQGLKLDEMLNNGQSDEQYLNSVLSGRDLMYSNRDIVNAKTNFSQEYLSNMYISNKYNNQNTSDSISDNSVKKTSTLHFVVVDKQGQMTSTTNTLSGYFGSGKYMDEGFYMNNSMTNFSDNKDSNNYHAKNTVPRSYISPTIIVGPDYYMGIGSPGGNKIPTILNEVIIDYLRGNGSLQDSIYKPRFYNDGNTVHFEKGMNKKYLDILQNQGYNIKEEKDNPNFGSVQAGIYHIKNKETEIANDVGTR